MIKRFVIAIVLLVLVAGGVVGFNIFRDRAIEDFFANQQAPALPVDSLVAEAAPWEPTLEAIGTVYSRHGIELATETGGVVGEVLFEANDDVEEGDILVRLDDEVEQADLAAAEASVTLAEQTLERVSSLGDRGVATASRLEEAQASVDSGRAQAQRIRALIAQKVAEAPFSGEIGIPEIEVGQFVTAGTAIATLQDVDDLRVDFSLPEQERPLIEIGQRVRVDAETGGSATGFITGIEPRVDPATRLVAVRATLDNRNGVLSPGQFVRVNVELPTEPGVVSLPQTAVVTSLYGDYVYAVEEAEEQPEGEDGEPRLVANQVFVQTGLRQTDRIEIVEGVAPGMRIVTAGQNRLSNGVPVTPDGTAPGPELGEGGPADEADSSAEPVEEASAAEAGSGAAQAAESR